jgi:hypothetical protein
LLRRRRRRRRQHTRPQNQQRKGGGGWDVRGCPRAHEPPPQQWFRPVSRQRRGSFRRGGNFAGFPAKRPPAHGVVQAGGWSTRRLRGRSGAVTREAAAATAVPTALCLPATGSRQGVRRGITYLTTHPQHRHCESTQKSKHQPAARGVASQLLPLLALLCQRWPWTKTRPG